MKARRCVLFAIAVLAAASQGLASDHQFSEMAQHFVSAWNSHNVTQMAGRFTENVLAVNATGQTILGRPAVAQALTAGTSSLTVTSAVNVLAAGRDPGTQERDLGYEGVVRFDVDISADANESTPLSITLQLVWGADLSAEHPGGRYFINSLRIDPK